MPHRQGDVRESGKRGNLDLSHLRLAALSFSLASILYAWLGLVAFGRARARGYDLGIFSQAAQSWAQGQLPFSSIKGRGLLSDHFSPITAVFGPAWRLWPDPRALIIVQALALGLAIGIAAWALPSEVSRRRKLAVLGCVIFALPMIVAASTEVHETALGAPIVAGLAWAILRGNARATVALGALGLLIKEDWGLTLIGCAAAWFLLHRRRRAPAWALAVLGVVGFLAANLTIRWLNQGDSPYANYFSSAGLSLERLRPALLFVAAAGLSRSPLLLIAVPTLAWRAASNNPMYWSINHHYDVIIVPIAAIALTQLTRASSRRFGVGLLAAAVVACMGVMTAYRLARGDLGAASHGPPVQAQVEQLMRKAGVPPGARVGADNDVALYLVREAEPALVEQTRSYTGMSWVMLDLGEDSMGLPRCAKDEWLSQVKGERWREGELVLVRLTVPSQVAFPSCL